MRAWSAVRPGIASSVARAWASSASIHGSSAAPAVSIHRYSSGTTTPWAVSAWAWARGGGGGAGWAVTDAAVRSASAPREPAVRAREPRRWSMSRGSKRSPRAGRIQRTRDIQVIAVRVHFPSRRRRVYARKAVLDGVGIHALRHAAITRLIERGVPVPIAQRSAGHADAPTTM